MSRIALGHPCRCGGLATCVGDTEDDTLVGTCIRCGTEHTLAHPKKLGESPFLAPRHVYEGPTAVGPEASPLDTPGASEPVVVERVPARNIRLVHEYRSEGETPEGGNDAEEA